MPTTTRAPAPTPDDPGDAPRDIPGRSVRGGSWVGLGAAIVVGLALVAIGLLRLDRAPRVPDVPTPASQSRTASPTAPASPSQYAAVPLAAIRLAMLPEATTDTTLPGAPIDEQRDSATGGTVVHNRTAQPVYDRPDGVAFAVLPVRQAGSDTWLPVIAEQPGWVRVMLPSRPNGATGWLARDHLELAFSPYMIRANVSQRSLELLRDGRVIQRWRVAVGAPATPTPTGRTFLLAEIHDETQTFSPLILALGTHSRVLTTYHGGPATTAIHTWNQPGVYGHAVSNGCLRVPPDALQVLAAVPLGTVVHIQS